MRGRSGGSAVGVDAGGTKVIAVLADVERDGAVVDRRQEAAAADDPEALAGAIARLARDLAAGHPGVSRVGVGAAGLVDDRGRVRFAPNLAWRDFPLAERVERAAGLSVTVENDASAAAWGEYRFGAARDCANVLMVTVGTGIGGGMIVGGRLFRGAHGFAGEIGHIVAEPGGPRCGCGNRGCWEQLAAGRAIDRLARDAAASHPESGLAKLARDPEAVDGAVAASAAGLGDPVAIGVLAEAGRRLGVGLAGLVNVLDPDVVVVGGGAMESGELILGPAREAFAVAVEGGAHRPPVPIVAAALGNDAGAVGAADLAHREAGER